MFKILLFHAFNIAFDVFINIMIKFVSTRPAHAFFIGEALLQGK